MNRRALPLPNIQDFLKICISLQLIILKIYSISFKLDEKEIERTADFYELGGYSINLIRFVGLIEKYFEIRIDIQTLAEYSSIKVLSERIQEIKNCHDQNEKSKIKGIVKRKKKYLLCNITAAWGLFGLCQERKFITL